MSSVSLINTSYSIKIKRSLDAIYHDFCIQLAEKPKMANKGINELVRLSLQIYALEKEIAKLKSSIANSKQFNRKVEMNLKLQAKEKELISIQNKSKK